MVDINLVIRLNESNAWRMIYTDEKVLPIPFQFLDAFFLCDSVYPIVTAAAVCGFRIDSKVRILIASIITYQNIKEMVCAAALNRQGVKQMLFRTRIMGIERQLKVACPAFSK